MGRLDADTTGALLLTNDGQLAHRLAHPRYGVEKTYVAEVEGDPDEDALRRLREGIELEDGRTAPARARRLGRGRVELVLHEGRNHQVKRMLAAVGHPVARLHRTAYAGLTLEGLEPGACRELEPSEVKRLTDLPASQPGSAGSVARLNQLCAWAFEIGWLLKVAPSSAALICAASASRCEVRLWI